ncbi:MAG: four helix bundle protein [Chloroflexota bacterium]
MAKGDDIEERLIGFAVRILKVCGALPETPVGRHIRGQLLRCGTSPAPNYGEARSAESQRDFVHKLKVVLKELNESRVWLKMLVRAELLSEQQLNELLDECDQLCRIMGSSIRTSHQNTQN